MSVAGASEWCFLDWSGFGASVPEKHLAAVGAADDEVGVEGGELGSQDVRLSVEDVLGTLMHVEIPHLNQTIRVMRSRRVLGVSCKNEFGELYTSST